MLVFGGGWVGKEAVDLSDSSIFIAVCSLPHEVDT